MEHTVTITTEGSEGIVRRLDGLAAWASSPAADRAPQLLDRLVDLVERPAELFSLHLDRLPAAGAGDLRARFEPGDLLLELVAATGAPDG